MMRNLIIGTLVLGLALGSMGCSRSPRVTFYTLEPAARLVSAGTDGTNGTAATGVAGGAGGAAHAAAGIVVGPVTLPELVDRPQLVLRVAANRVEILESQRWAEPLRSGIPRVIAENLEALLGVRAYSFLQHTGSNAPYRIILDIKRFEALPGEGVSVEAAWSLRGTGSSSPTSGRSSVHVPAVGDGNDPLVAAYGRALLAVSADLAQAIRADAAAGR
jgi:uncharacterized protein